MKPHYHYVNKKRVGICDGVAYQRFGPDVMRKEAALGFSAEVIGKLFMEGVQWVIAAGMHTSLANFKHAKLESYGGYEPQLFLPLEYWISGPQIPGIEVISERTL